MKHSFPAFLLIAVMLGLSPAHATDHATKGPMPNSQTDASAGHDLAPRLVLSSPDAETLKGGYVYLSLRVENMSILPMYPEVQGKEVSQLKPTIGHLHVKVDDNRWSWIHASSDPIYFGPLPSGVHQMKIELADAAHAVIETQTVRLVMP
ncbi:DUF6130 family protein [Sphingobium sp.]|uniref:DUF6130 family protein n=1 Tax=Sphingobium sp. TaxID=1912891 RepID=UPI002C96567B|nr:DUF6130 family protein [Sphingobium sp.]HUD93654.1 DUF6130 family protein [Sphingobium sp.]